MPVGVAPAGYYGAQGILWGCNRKKGLNEKLGEAGTQARELQAMPSLRNKKLTCFCFLLTTDLCTISPEKNAYC